MAWHPGLEALRDSLAEIFPSSADAKLIATDAQLPLQFIDFDEAAIHIWTELLTVAQTRGKVPDVIAVAQGLVPQNSELARAIVEYQKFEQERIKDGGEEDKESEQEDDGDGKPAKRRGSPQIWAAIITALAVILAAFAPYIIQNLNRPQAPVDVLALLEKDSLSNADIEQVKAFLEDNTVSQQQKVNALFKLGKPGWSNVIPVLEEVAQSTSDTSMRTGALAALGRIGEPSQPALLRFLHHEASIVRTESLRALSMLPLSDEIVSGIVTFLRTASDPFERQVAVEVLGTLKAFTAIDEILFRLKTDHDAQVRTQAARTLVIFGSVPTVRSALRESAQQDAEGTTRVAAIQSLVQLQDVEAIPIFEELLSNPSLVVRTEAAAALDSSQSWTIAGNNSNPAPTVTETPVAVLAEGTTGRAPQTLTIYVGPNEAEAGNYPSGTVVIIVSVDPSGEWAYVKFPDDELGWISVGAVDWDQGGSATAQVINNLWPNGDTIDIVFLDGEASLKQTAIEAAQQWTRYANLNFSFIEEPSSAEIDESDVRISFDQPGAWSFLGTSALKIPKDQPTMNLGLVTATNDEAERTRIVLHEFGHVLGLNHEVNNPNRDIPWDRTALFAYYENLGMSADMVERQYLATWDRATFPIDKPFDRYSVMMEAIPTRLTIGSYQIDKNYTLSAIDKEFVAKLYPGRNPDPVETSVPNTEPVADLAADDPLYPLAQAVGELAYSVGGGSTLPLCTAFVISDEYIVTASYCVTAVEPSAYYVLRLGKWDVNATPHDYPVDRDPVEMDEGLGYAILQVEGTPASDFGAIPLTSRTPSIGDASIMIFHYEGNPLTLSRDGCTVVEHQGDEVDESAFYHTCDRGGGSGGAPILAADNLSLLGLHFASTNDVKISAAKRMDMIIEQSDVMQEVIAESSP